MVNAGDAAAALPQSDVDAGQLLERLLQLIDGSSSIEQITPERVSATMQAQLQRSDQGFGYGARLTPHWMYRVELSDNAILGRLLFFNIFNNDGTQDGSLSDVCQLDFEQFEAELHSRGFTSAPQHGEHGRRLGFTFVCDGLTVDVEVNGESADNPTHLCVQAVRVH